jgi:hypothetical protein
MSNVVNTRRLGSSKSGSAKTLGAPRLPSHSKVKLYTSLHLDLALIASAGIVLRSEIFASAQRDHYPNCK